MLWNAQYLMLRRLQKEKGLFFLPSALKNFNRCPVLYKEERNVTQKSQHKSEQMTLAKFHPVYYQLVNHFLLLIILHNCSQISYQWVFEYSFLKTSVSCKLILNKFRYVFLLLFHLLLWRP
jgi:hypothetical protein